MPSTRALKLRIRSVKNTKQITKAMQLVAASKMRRAQEISRATQAYTLAARELLTRLSAQEVTNSHPLFTDRKVKSRLIVMIAADKGLAGAYNSNVFKQYIRELKADDEKGIKNSTIAVGRRASHFVTRLKDTKVAGVYEDMPDNPDGTEMKAILDTAQELFEKGDVDAVDVIYTQFHTSISQEVIVHRVLPAGFEPTEATEFAPEITYEPSAGAVLDGIAYRLVGAQLYQAMLDAHASEWSMRMLAMKNATDNASDLADDLTLAMNKARQGAITQELAEISGGVEAMKD